MCPVDADHRETHKLLTVICNSNCAICGKLTQFLIQYVWNILKINGSLAHDLVLGMKNSQWIHQTRVQIDYARVGSKMFDIPGYLHRRD